MFPTAMPTSRRPDPRRAPPVRWGVLGTGWIAEHFATALHRDTRQRVVAVGSRTVASAQEFADRTGAARARGSYADLVADPDVDVVHIATPHNHHHAHALLALDAGKHVLVEKPIALNAAEAQEIADRATAQCVYCAEALWTFCLPRYDVIRQLLDDGVLGDIHTVLADNGEWLPATHRIYRRDLAGGPLLDLGTYPLALANWVLGEPDARHRAARARRRGQRPGVDRAAARQRRPVHDHHDHDGRYPHPGRTRGHPSHAGRRWPLLHPGNLTLVSAGKGSTLRWTEPPIGHEALYVTAVEAAHRVAVGETETPLRPLADSVATLRVIDEVRRQIGITFVGESAPGMPARADR